MHIILRDTLKDFYIINIFLFWYLLHRIIMLKQCFNAIINVLALRFVKIKKTF